MDELQGSDLEHFILGVNLRGKADRKRRDEDGQRKLERPGEHEENSLWMMGMPGSMRRQPSASPPKMQP